MGLIGVGGGEGVVAGGGALGASGVVMVIQPGNALSASDRTRTKTMTKVFRFILFMAIYIIS